MLWQSRSPSARDRDPSLGRSRLSRASSIPSRSPSPSDCRRSSSSPALACGERDAMELWQGKQYQVADLAKVITWIGVYYYLPLNARMIQ